jgi:hypothetical protein
MDILLFTLSEKMLTELMEFIIIIIIIIIFFHQCLPIICVGLYCNYRYLDCAVSVIDLLAVE